MRCPGQSDERVSFALPRQLRIAEDGLEFGAARDKRPRRLRLRVDFARRPQKFPSGSFSSRSRLVACLSGYGKLAWLPSLNGGVFRIFILISFIFSRAK
jgi:hypothetical protein